MTPGGGSLLHRAAECLVGGPAHTLDLAREVLGLSGHPGALSQAVFTLLGADGRFRVDGRGVWSLHDAHRLPGAPLRDIGFAVVDVETTGGSFEHGHRIMEIAVVEVRGGAVVDEWYALVNPGRPVPLFVQALTGIRLEMVWAAPHFDHIAGELHDRLEGRVFVAHNAAFDWRFVSTELAEAIGQVPDVARLCTVRLTRTLVPRLRCRNLDAVSAHFEVVIHQRHRAYGDALATARVLLRLLDEATVRGVADLEALLSLARRRRWRSRRGGAVTAAHGRTCHQVEAF